ncbi:MAG: cytochrome P460 family protein [Burkholderiales bacterium]|nr:cytochrome P460 family protein [Burkholderiales bacterium]
MRNLAATLVVVLVAGLAPTSHATEVAYPIGYREWHHVKSMIINDGHPLFAAFGGIHHIYANRKAVQGYKAGKFPDGAVIVFDLLATKSANNAVEEGERKVVGVMVKNAQRYKATGGWGYEGFKGDSRDRVVAGKAAEACFACHTSQKDRDYVFSSLRK